MDEVVPGTRFLDVTIDDAAVNAVAATLRSLRDQPAPSVQMPMIAGWLRDRLLDEALVDLPPDTRIAPRRERRAALAVLDALDADRPVAALCHGDMSFGNVLLDDHGQAVLVDPRGMAGELAYDVAIVALWAAYCSPAYQADRLADRLGVDVGVDPRRVRAFIAAATAARATRAVP